VNKRMLFSLALGALLVAGCSKTDAPTEVAAAATKTAPATAPAAAAPDYYETSGPLVVENQVDVLAQREGVIAQLGAEIGSRVQKGQLLAQLDDRQIQADKEALQSRILSIEANVKTWEAEAKVLENDYERDQQMFKEKLITEKQLDHSRFKMIGSGYQLERERHLLKTARAELRSLELEMEKTRITAPFAGVVARRYVRNGQRVVLNDRLFWVTATEPVNVHFTLPDSFLGKIVAGQEITVLAQSAPELQAKARVKTVSPVADPASGTIEVMAVLGPAPSAMQPGTTATIRIPKAR